MIKICMCVRCSEYNDKKCTGTNVTQIDVYTFSKKFMGVSIYEDECSELYNQT